MPQSIKRHKLATLQPRIKELPPRLKVLNGRTLKQKQIANGRTLALDGAEWRKLRAMVLSSEPLCRHCTARGLTVPATEVDHRDNNPANNELVNLCPLCKPCHSRKTASDMGHRVSMGCDINGRPLDPNHHWNAAERGEISPATGTPKPPGSLRAQSRS